MPRIKILVNMMRMLHSKYFILAVFIISKKTEQHLEWSKCENVVFSFWYPLPKHKAYTNFTNNLLCNQFLRKEKISNIYLQYAVFLVKIYYHNYTIRYLILVIRSALGIFIFCNLDIQFKIWNQIYSGHIWFDFLRVQEMFIPFSINNFKRKSWIS